MLVWKTFHSNSSVICGRQVREKIAYILWKVSYFKGEKGSYESPPVQTIIFHGDWAAVFQPFPSCVSLKCSQRLQLGQIKHTELHKSLKLTCQQLFVSFHSKLFPLVGYDLKFVWFHSNCIIGLNFLATLEWGNLHLSGDILTGNSIQSLSRMAEETKRLCKEQFSMSGEDHSGAAGRSYPYHQYLVLTFSVP